MEMYPHLRPSVGYRLQHGGNFAVAHPLREAGVRRDLARFLAAVSNRDTLAAARTFPDFRRPVLIVWGKNDPFFAARYAVRLQRDFPDATLDYVSPSRAFVPEDQPDALARYIARFVGTTAHA